MLDLNTTSSVDVIPAIDETGSPRSTPQTSAEAAGSTSISTDTTAKPPQHHIWGRTPNSPSPFSSIPLPTLDAVVQSPVSHTTNMSMPMSLPGSGLDRDATLNLDNVTMHQPASFAQFESHRRAGIHGRTSHVHHSGGLNSDDSSGYTPSPDRHRVRWDTAPPQSTSSSPLTTGPSYPTMTPLWTSTPPGLRTFPPSAYPTQTPPWWFTPHPLPPSRFTPLHTVPLMAPNPLYSAYGGMNQTLPSGMQSQPPTSSYGDRPHRNSGDTPQEDAPVPDQYGRIPELRNSGLGAMSGQQPYVYEQPHDRFFLRDGNIDFRIGNVLFRVHRHFFFPQTRAFLLMGPIADLPLFAIDLTMYGFSAADFASLLSIFYPKTYGTLEINSVEGWTSVLQIACVLGIDHISALAIEQLSHIASPVDRIMLARECGIDKWLVPAFRELCLKPQSLSEEDGRKIGVEGLVKLNNIKSEMQENAIEYLDSAKVDQMLRRVVEG